LVARYWAFAKEYYLKDGKPTGEIHPLKQALRYLRRLYGPTSAAEFTPLKLKAIREAMVVHPITRTVKVIDPGTGEARLEPKVIRVGLSRRVVNKQLSRVRRVFAWAVAEELVAADVHAALTRVEGLKKGRSAAREKPRVRPVEPDVVARTLPLLTPTLRAMVEVQRLTGCRPQEVVRMRADEIDTGGDVWEYRPRTHKTAHHNGEDDPDRDRVIFLGPKAQAVLKPLMGNTIGGYIFSPACSEEERRRVRALARKLPVRPVTGRRRSVTARSRREHYDVETYRKAIHWACRRAGFSAWSPNQLRHLRLTELRRLFGLEASRVCGGHREIGVTQHYAEQNLTQARQVMSEIG
jgi:integrase